MKKPRIIALILALGLLQATVLNHFRFFGVAPDVLLAITAISGIFFKGNFALFLSLFAGVLKDSLSTGVFGFNTVLFPLWCWLVIKLSKEVSLDDKYALSAVAAVLSLLNNIVSRFLFFYLGKPVSWGVFFRLSVIDSVYTALISLLLFGMLDYFKLLPDLKNENPNF